MRRFSYLLLAACLCVSVTGCDGDTAATTDESAVSAPASEAGHDGSDAKEGEGSADKTTEEAAEE